ncbi:LysR family transcriptional regulator [bacterium NHP-B]|nr:LysR family transcriptional regulator [bacterium NHP-B]
MPNIRNLKAFVSLSENACDFGIHTQLGIPRSTLWSCINDLERETGLQLVLRKKQNNVLTEEGKNFAPYAQRLIKLFEEGVAQAQTSESDEPEGEIIIATTSSMANSWVMPSVKGFQAFYPKIKLRIIAGDMIDTATEMISDIIFRPIADKDFLLRHWHLSYCLGLFASPDYLENHGVPETPEDLVNHSMIGYGEHVFSYCPEIDWHLKGRWPGFPKLHPKVTINSTLSLYRAAIESIGICSSATEANIFYNGKLVRVLPQINGPEVKVHFSTKKGLSRKLERNVQVFNNFFVNHLRNIGIEVKNEEEAA